MLIYVFLVPLYMTAGCVQAVMWQLTTLLEHSWIVQELGCYKNIPLTEETGMIMPNGNSTCEFCFTQLVSSSAVTYLQVSVFSFSSWCRSSSSVKVVS